MRGRWKVIAAAGVGMAAGFLGALALASVRAQDVPGVQVWTQGGIAHVLAGSPNDTFFLYLDPRSLSQPTAFGPLPAGRVVRFDPRRFDVSTVGSMPGEYTFDPTNLRWVECEPGSCNVPPRDLNVALLREFPSCVGVITDNAENTQTLCCDKRDNDGDCLTDEDDSECGGIVCPSPKP